MKARVRIEFRHPHQDVIDETALRQLQLTKPGSPKTPNHAVGNPHPGVLVAKVGYFGVKSAKVHPEQMGTKPAKVGHLAANLLKYVPNKKKKKKTSL